MNRSIFFLLVVAAVIFSSCATVYRVQIPEKSEIFTIHQLKGVPEIHARSVLFINSNHKISEKCLIFEGFYPFEQLFKEGVNGLPELQVVPSGYFKIDFAIARHASEKLVGFFEPRRDYTILCFLENIAGQVVDMQTVYVCVPGTTAKVRYWYTNTFNQPSEKWVNWAVNLPWYSGGGFRFSNQPTLSVNLNALLGRLMEKVLGTNPDPEPVRQLNPSPTDSILIGFPALPDSTL